MTVLPDRATAAAAHGREGVPDTLLPERLLTVEELSTMLGVSVRWIHERTRLGQIPCYRLPSGGRMLRFDPKEVRRWLEQYHAGNNAHGGAR